MFYENVIMATLVALSTMTNVYAFTNGINLSDVDLLDEKHPNFTIRDDNVILHSFFGQLIIPIPEKEKSKLETSGKLRTFPGSSVYDNIPSSGADFFECNEQAQLALSTHSDNYRYWDPFFKRNSIDDTIAVRYCCNLLEYVQTAQDSLSPECRDQVRLQDHVMTVPKVRHTCRQYEFYNMQCFLVRWMYWWIPCLALILIAFGICGCCWAIS